jgi:hypothetical protein
MYADGMLDGSFKRRNTKKTTWPEAKQIVTSWESPGTWDESTRPLPPVPSEIEPPDAKTFSITVVFATDAYVANPEGRSIASATLRKYKSFVRQLRDFATHKGYVQIDQFATTDMDEFYSRWKHGIRARAKKLEGMNGFFESCPKRKWISENPARDLEHPVGSGSAANRLPFTDAELTRIYESCDKLPPGSMEEQ